MTKVGPAKRQMWVVLPLSVQRRKVYPTEAAATDAAGRRSQQTIVAHLVRTVARARRRRTRT